jgi:myo-inositol-1(or 4)-monophosphatase
VRSDIQGWEWIAAIHKLCQQAGQLQVQHFRQNPPGWGETKVEKEYVSWIDIETERMLKAGLATICPEAGFYGEESGQSGDQTVYWLVDPLDGTTNYLSGLEQFAISIALMCVHEPELAVVYKPVTAEWFAAVRGQGARQNDQPLPRQTAFPIERAVVCTGFPYRSPDLMDTFLWCAKDILHAVRDIRRLGCAALDLCYVAVGYLQGFWESDLQPYDIAAALLILQETDCPYSAAGQATYDMFTDRVLVAGRPGVHEALHAIVTRHYAPERTGL